MEMSVFEPANGVSVRDAVHRLLEDSFVRPQRGHSLTAFPVDVMETAEAVIVKASVPGVSKESLQVSYEKEFLTIKAELAQENAPEKGRFLLKERSFGTMSRTFRLPFAVDVDQAGAQYKDGVLTLTLPKQESVKPRIIQIQ